MKLFLTMILVFSLGNLRAQNKDSIYNAETKLKGVKFIKVFGKYKVWTRKIGSGKTKILLLHGGPGHIHEYLQPLADELAAQGFEVYLYDQLGSYFSDQPEIIPGDTLWTPHERIDEVEQVRKALGLDHFIIYGHSWGAFLAIAYNIKYPYHISGLIFSNGIISMQSWNKRNTYIQKYVDSTITQNNATATLVRLKESQKTYDTAKYNLMADSIFENTFLRHHNLWTQRESTMFNTHSNFSLPPEVFKHASQIDAYCQKITTIKNPVLIISGKYDMVSSENDLRILQPKIKNCKLIICENSAHFPMDTEPKKYFGSIIRFIKNQQKQK